MADLLHFEKELWAKGIERIAGIDEAGRGPLAGPVITAAVLFDRSFLESEKAGVFSSLTDSKQLTPVQRERFFSLLTGEPSIQIGIGAAEAEEIDSINILNATHRTMFRALVSLPSLPDYVLVDGLPVPNLPCSSMAIVKGDARSLSIAAASVIAKVTRDRLMVELDKQYPKYGFKRHKGYGTTMHIKALLEYGPLPVHRKSFAPVAEIFRIRNSSLVSLV
jgi:ribonuclease HII